MSALKAGDAVQVRDYKQWRDAEVAKAPKDGWIGVRFEDGSTAFYNTNHVRKVS